MRLASLLLLGPLFLAPTLHAASLSYTGSLDPNNPNDVFLVSFTVGSSSEVVIQSYGYGGSANAPGGTNAAGTVIPSGGFDTYFSLFTGTGSAATFFISNDDGSCPPGDGATACADSTLDLILSAGSYTLALTQPSNFSIAENYGYGDLGDGFISLAGDYTDYYTAQVRTSNYAFDITGDVTSGGGTMPPTVPEPSSLLLLSTGVFSAAGAALRRRKRSLTAAAFAFTAMLALSPAVQAQKPALTKNVDEQGRLPYSQSLRFEATLNGGSPKNVNTTCNSIIVCTVYFTQVPPGFRLVITHVSVAYTLSAAGARSLVSLAGATSMNGPDPLVNNEIFLPRASFTGTDALISTPITYYVEAGYYPEVTVFPITGQQSFNEVHISGYLVNLSE